MKVEPLSAFDLERLRAYAQTLPQYQHDFSAFVILRLLATMDAKEGEIQELDRLLKAGWGYASAAGLREENTRLERENAEYKVLTANLKDELAMADNLYTKTERERITAVSMLEWEKSTHAAFVAVHHATVEKLTKERVEIISHYEGRLSNQSDAIADRYVEIDSLRADLAKAKEELWGWQQTDWPVIVVNLKANLAKAREEIESYREAAKLGLRDDLALSKLITEHAEQSRALAAGDEMAAITCAEITESHTAIKAAQRAYRALRPEIKGLAPEKAPLDPTLMRVAADVLESHLLRQPAPETCKVKVAITSLGCDVLCANPLPCTTLGHAEAKK